MGAVLNQLEELDKLHGQRAFDANRTQPMLWQLLGRRQCAAEMLLEKGDCYSETDRDHIRQIIDYCNEQIKKILFI